MAEADVRTTISVVWGFPGWIYQQAASHIAKK